MNKEKRMEYIKFIMDYYVNKGLSEEELGRKYDYLYDSSYEELLVKRNMIMKELKK